MLLAVIYKCFTRPKFPGSDAIDWGMNLTPRTLEQGYYQAECTFIIISFLFIMKRAIPSNIYAVLLVYYNLCRDEQFL